MGKIKSLLIRLIGEKGYFALKRRLDTFLFKYRKTIYSQNGEDCFIENYFRGKQNGVYVDVGSFHPRQFSNTYKLYEKYNWSGVTIDARPGSAELFRQVRPRDISIECPISSTPQKLDYFSWGDHSENTMDPDQANALQQRLGPPLETQLLETKTLASVLDQSLKEVPKIDLLNVDVEGLDLDVLKSNDWSKYRPKLVVVEIFEGDLSSLVKTPTFEFLKNEDYKMVGWLNPSVIFEDCQSN